jgi:DNA-binding transcriptional LysR family regulator
MEIRQLEAFAAVMAAGSVTGAARLLERSQPAITRLVQELEAEIGYELFLRKGPRVTPTEQGLLLFDEVERGLGALQRIRERAAEIARGQSGPLLLAATSALAVGLLPEALRLLEARDGARAVHLRTAAPEEVVRSVAAGAVQLGLTSLPFEHEGLRAHWIGQVACIAVLREDHPLAGRRQVPLAEIVAQRLVTLQDPQRLRQRIAAALARQGGDRPEPPPTLETNSSVNAMAMVRAGLGLAVVEPVTPRGLLPAGLVARPLDAEIPYLFGVVSPQARPLPQALQALVDALLQSARDLPGFVHHEPGAYDTLLRRLQGSLPESPRP